MRRRAVWLLLAGVVVAGILFLFVLPGRTWLAQQRSMAVAHQRVAELSRENAALAQRVKDLHNDAYIEHRAREQFGLIKPGEKAYSILPTTTTTTVPAHPPSATTTTTPTRP
jgi:cell division protein FtsB